MPHHFGIGPGLLKFLVDSTGISGHFTLLLISVMTFTFCLLNELNKEEFPLEKYLRETGFFFFQIKKGALLNDRQTVTVDSFTFILLVPELHNASVSVS